MPYADPAVRRAHMKKYYHANRDARRAYAKARYAAFDDETKLASVAMLKKWTTDNPEKAKASAMRRYTDRPIKRMLYQAADRAKRKGLEFDLTESDIFLPETCPVLGIPLTARAIGGRPCDNSMSLDRIDNSKGYVKGNAIVVSWRANRIKSDASIEELKRVVEFYSGVRNDRS